MLLSKTRTFLITGCEGQIGRRLAERLSSIGHVVPTDIKPESSLPSYEVCDVTKSDQVNHVFNKYKPSHVIHLSAILSGAGEKNPELAKKVNIDGFMNVLEAAKSHKCQLLSPSTIAAFGTSTPRRRTPDVTVMRPTTIYGVSKVFLELMGEYYHHKFGLDFRSIRLPGVISPEPIHGLGTTDYAVDMFQSLKQGKMKYSCYLNADTRLPMVYIDDTIDAFVKLLEAPSQRLRQRVYNINGFDVTPAELAASINRQLAGHFECIYDSDFRQAIADSWPESLHDVAAHQDWAWKPRINSVDRLVQQMFQDMSIDCGRT